MRISLVTIRVPGKKEYDFWSDRWVLTYRRFRPSMKHDLIVFDSGEPSAPGAYEDIASCFLSHSGNGWDCGIWQFAAKHINTDLLICCNTSTYFFRHGWMDRIVDEVNGHGVGLYGVIGSFEGSQHLRTPCIAFQPEVIRKYPITINSRPKSYLFECSYGKKNLTQWCYRKGYTPRMVTWDGCYEIEDWRYPNNIFRRGDQSNILVKDKHVDIYENATDEERIRLERLADGLAEEPPVETSTQETIPYNNVSSTQDMQSMRVRRE